jgi:predicted RecA/RadA family phage recombinase
MSQATYVQRGEAIDYTPTSDVAAGQVVVQSARCGVARTPISANTPGSLATCGLFTVVKATGAINVGAALFWDADGNPQGGVAGTGCLTTTSTDNTFFGFAAAAAAETDTTVSALLVGVPSVTNTIHNALTAVIADPGASGAIPVTNGGTCQIVTAAAETRTLAVPTSVGQVLSLCMKTDGGNCTITVASAINQTGNNTIQLNDPGDTLVLVGIQNGANKAWRVVVNDGCTLSTV